MTSMIGKSLGRYHILEQIGRGGMATVYKALDTQLNRQIAIKIIKADKSRNKIAKKRFKFEATAMAKLSHPNIIKILDYGEYEEYPCLIMQYIEGYTLKDRILENGKPFKVEEAAKILAPIARALAYSHNSMVVHRDVKPSNIIIDSEGKPMLTDFGIAKLLETELTIDLTSAGVGIGTPEYMAPEQVKNENIDFRADIYSLGVIFFEMLTGRKPFQADTPLAVAIKHVNDELPRPRQFNRSISPQVENIILRALCKNPDDRFPTMGEFAKILEELADRQSPVYKSSIKKEKTTFHKNQLNQKLLLSSLIGIIGVIVIILFSPWKIIFGDISPANQNTLPPYPLPTISSTHEKISEISPTNTISPTILVAFDETIEPIKNLKEITNESVHFLSQIDIIEIPSLVRINEMAVNIDGTLMAVASVDSNIYIWDLLQKQLLATLETHTSGVRSIAFSSDGNYLASGSDDYDVHIWYVPDMTLIGTLESKGRSVKTLEFSPDNSMLLVGYADTTVRLWDVNTRSLKYTIFHPTEILDGTFTIQGESIATSMNGSSEIRIWKTSNGSNQMILEGHQYPVRTLKYAPDGNHLVSGDMYGSIFFWDMKSGEYFTGEKFHSSDIRVLEFNQEGSLVVSGAADGKIVIQDMEGNLLATLSKHATGIVGLGFINSESTLISCSWDGKIILWGIQ